MTDDFDTIPVEYRRAHAKRRRRPAMKRNVYPSTYTWTGIDPSTGEEIEVEYIYDPGEHPIILGRPGFEGDYPGSPADIEIVSVTPDVDYDETQLGERILEDLESYE
jgi:hypothetical protein